MACNLCHRLAYQVGKSHSMIQSGLLGVFRTCTNEVNKGQSAGQSTEATYGAPEYFEYNEYSFNDIHCEMEKYRLPRPSSISPSDNK